MFFKEHTFFDERNNTTRVGRFDSDPEIVNAWLEIGDFTKKDIDLLNHEIRESRVEGIFRTNYEDAHRATERKGWIWILD